MSLFLAIVSRFLSHSRHLPLSLRLPLAPQYATIKCACMYRYPCFWYRRKGGGSAQQSRTHKCCIQCQKKTVVGQAKTYEVAEGKLGTGVSAKVNTLLGPHCAISGSALRTALVSLWAGLKRV